MVFDKHIKWVYVIPLATGIPELITPIAPSYLHGWSPDGKLILIGLYKRSNELITSKTVRPVSAPIATYIMNDSSL